MKRTEKIDLDSDDDSDNVILIKSKCKLLEKHWDYNQITLEDLDIELEDDEDS